MHYDDDDDGPLLRPRAIVKALFLTATSAAIIYNTLFLQPEFRSVTGGQSISASERALDRLFSDVGASRAAPARTTTRVKVSPLGPAPATGPMSEVALLFAIQSELAAMKLYRHAVDGQLGPATRQAIRSFQRSHGLAITGRPSHELLERIRFNRRLNEAAKYTGSISPGKGTQDTFLVQSGLAKLGYAPGPVDGVMREQTRQALKRFQRDRRLPVTGKISNRLLVEFHKISGR